MPCQCLLGKSPAFIARDQILTEKALEIYTELVSPDWSSDDAQPEELTEAIGAIQQHWGQHPCGDYAEACDWAGYMVSERALANHEYSGTTQRETDLHTAVLRGEA